MSGALRDVVRELAAQSQGVVGGIFDTTKLDEDGVAALRLAVTSLDFDFSQLRSGLQRLAKTDRVPVVRRNLGPDLNAVVEVPRKPTLQINADLIGAPQNRQAVVLTGEAAHLVDAYLLTEPQRQAIIKTFGGGKGDVWFNDEPRVAHHHPERPASLKTDSAYFRQIGESFMGGFIYAFSSLKIIPDMVEGFKFKPTPAIGAEIRRIITAGS